MEKVKKYFTRYKEQILYILVGGGTTAVDWGLYAVLVLFLPATKESLLVRISPNFRAYCVAWLGAVCFAYVLSRRFVFESKNPHVFREMGAFFLSRFATLVLSVAFDVCFCGDAVFHVGMNAFLAKAIVSVAVIVVNYLTSKLLVFRKKTK